MIKVTFQHGWGKEGLFTDWDTQDKTGPESWHHCSHCHWSGLRSRTTSLLPTLSSGWDKGPRGHGEGANQGCFCVRERAAQIVGRKPLGLPCLPPKVGDSTAPGVTGWALSSSLSWWGDNLVSLDLELSLRLEPLSRGQKGS